jgi:predicted P-loop ATPase/GTPase
LVAKGSSTTGLWLKALCMFCIGPVAAHHIWPAYAKRVGLKPITSEKITRALRRVKAFALSSAAPGNGHFCSVPAIALQAK